MKIILLNQTAFDIGEVLDDDKGVAVYVFDDAILQTLFHNKFRRAIFGS